MKKIIILFVVGMLFIPCLSYAQKPRYIKTDTYEGVVFPMFWATDPKKEKYAYMPTNKEIAIMEKKIADSIGALFTNFVEHHVYKGNCNFKQNLRGFIRQYTGEKIGRNKEIFTIFYWTTNSENWKEEQLDPNGRGRCDVFMIKYSITSGKFISFYTDLSDM